MPKADLLTALRRVRFSRCRAYCSGSGGNGKQPFPFHIDALEMARSIEAQGGLPTKQAQAITLAITGSMKNQEHQAALLQREIESLRIDLKIIQNDWSHNLNNLKAETKNEINKLDSKIDANRGSKMVACFCVSVCAISLGRLIFC